MKTAMVRCNYGRWRWSEQQPKPRWNAIKSAAVWKEDQHSSIRTALSKPPATVTPSATGDQAIKQLQFQLPSLPDISRTLTVYTADEHTVPPAMSTVVPRGAVVLLDGSDFLAPQIKYNLDKMPVMLFGETSHCHRLRSLVQQFFPNSKMQTLWVYIKPQQPDPRVHHKFEDRCIVLIGDEAALKFQVLPYYWRSASSSCQSPLLFEI